MHRNVLSLLLVPALALSACGRAETGESTPDAPRPVQSEAPAAPAGEAVRGGSADEAASLPVAELPAGETAVGTPAQPGSPPAVAPAQPAPQQPSAQQPAAPPAGSATADEILRRVERTYADVRSMQADFVQHLNVPLLGTNQRSEGQLFQRRPDRFLMRFSDPAGDIMVADGRHFWMYNPSVDRRQVIRSRLTAGGAEVDLQQQFLSNPTQRFVSTLVGTETVDGRATHVLSLVPRGQSQYRLIRVWVDQQNHLVRRFEMTEENESVRRIELRNLRLNVDLPDSLFQFSPPAGTQVFDQ
jgi:outer membrane lipoprotein carrier protein